MTASKKLFRADETYAEPASELYEEATAAAVKLLKKYKDYPIRDVETIIQDAVDYQAVFFRMDKQLKRAKKKEQARKKRARA